MAGGQSQRFSLVLVALLPLLASGAQAAGVSVQGLPPSVIRTFPTSGDRGVDPSVKEVRVTFSKEMITREQWSFVQIAPGAFPEIAGEIHYLKDRRTCVMPVRLEPGKRYAIWVNSPKYNNFKDTSHQSAVPYLLVFETHD